MSVADYLASAPPEAGEAAPLSPDHHQALDTASLAPRRTEQGREDER